MVTDDIYWYYVIEIGFYLSLLVSQFTDVKRKDFWQMFLHHVITLSLLSYSFICNFTRIGTLIVFLHDCTDFLLEFAKMGTYANWGILCDVTFGLFTLIWLLTRIIAFPLV